MRNVRNLLKSPISTLFERPDYVPIISQTYSTVSSVSFVSLSENADTRSESQDQIQQARSQLRIRRRKLTVKRDRSVQTRRSERPDSDSSIEASN